MPKVLNYEIDDLTYLTIDYIVMEKVLCSGRMLETNNVIKWLVDKALKEYIVENNDIDMRELARAYGIDGKSDGEKIIVLCPFHNDHNPSGVIFKERFHCSTCNITLNYYDFIAKMEGTNDKEVILKKLHELVG